MLDAVIWLVVAMLSSIQPLFENVSLSMERNTQLQHGVCVVTTNSALNVHDCTMPSVGMLHLPCVHSYSYFANCTQVCVDQMENQEKIRVFQVSLRYVDAEILRLLDRRLFV